MDNIECSKKDSLISHSTARLLRSHTYRLRTGGGIAFALMQFRSASHVERGPQWCEPTKLVSRESNLIRPCQFFTLCRRSFSGGSPLCVCVCVAVFSLYVSIFMLFAPIVVALFPQRLLYIPIFHQRFLPANDIARTTRRNAFFLRRWRVLFLCAPCARVGGAVCFSQFDIFGEAVAEGEKSVVWCKHNLSHYHGRYKCAMARLPPPPPLLDSTVVAAVVLYSGTHCVGSARNVPFSQCVYMCATVHIREQLFG